MCDRQVLACNGGSLLIGQPCILSSLRLLLAIPEFGNVPPVVGLHLVVENLRLTSACLADQIAVQERKDLVTNRLQLALHLCAILLCPTCLLGVLLGLLLLLHTADDAPSSAA